MVLVVALAGVDTNELFLHGTLHSSRHVLIEGLQAEGHPKGLVVAILGTVVALHQRTGKVDALDEAEVGIDITAKDAAQAVVATGTQGAVAHNVGSGFLAELFFGILYCHFLQV